MNGQRAGALDDLVVLELGHVMAGPVCGLMLADLGADVIKVEAPTGDPSRRFLPPAIGTESAAYMMLNRNKRGITLNLKEPRGREALLRLVDTADVLIENFRAGTMETLGLDYETLRGRNPRIIYCQISGFGRTGPFASLGGFDLIAQGYSGLMSVTGEGPGRPPVKCGVPLTDITAGILAAMGVLGAVHAREKTGKGQLVDTSLFEAGITHTFWHSAIALATGTFPGPLGSAHPLSAPYEAFQTADGWITLGASSQSVWERLPPALEAPQLLADRRFSTNELRMKHREILAEMLAEIFITSDTQTWLARLEKAGVPAGPVLGVTDMLTHPQTRAREMVQQVTHSTAGVVETLGSPVKLSDTPTTVRRAAPTLGQHSNEILATLGFAAADIESMIADGVVVVPRVC